MEKSELIELSLDNLEVELSATAYTIEYLEAAQELEIAGKNRSGALELYSSAIEDASDADVTTGEEKIYVIANGVSMRFKAGKKSNGDVIDLSWPEYTANETLLAQHLERGLVKEK